jgi:hypothetical protein
MNRGAIPRRALMTDPNSPSVWCHGRPKAKRSISPVSTATSEYVGGQPRRPVCAGVQAAIASGVTQTVRLPRCRTAASYSFSTL